MFSLSQLQSFVNLESLGSRGDGNDIWGWTDPQTSREYAIMGLEDGTSFIDVTNPTEPSVLGFLPTHTVSSLWRDIKVHNNHAYVGRNRNSERNQFYCKRGPRTRHASLRSYSIALFGEKGLPFQQWHFQSLCGSSTSSNRSLQWLRICSQYCHQRTDWYCPCLLSF